MASRVNTKFVVILAASLVAVGVGVAGVYLFVEHRSGDRMARLGEAAAAKGDFAGADLYYSKAVARQQTNLDWLKAWREVREKKIPTTQTVYEQDYGLYVYGILQQLARVQGANVEAHREMLQAMYEQRAQFASGREGWQSLIDQVQTSLKYFEGQEPPSIRRYRGLAIASIAAQGLETKEADLDQAVADLNAAIAADPADTLAAYELSALHRYLAARSRKVDNLAKSEEHLSEARRLIADAAAKNPGDARAQIGVLISQATDISSEVSDTNPVEAMRARTAALEAMKPSLDQLLATLRGPAGKTLDHGLLVQMMQLTLAIDPASGVGTTAELTEHCLKADPDSATHLMMRAQLYVMEGKFDEAIATFQRVVELPQPPISLEGIRLFGQRKMAIFGQADAALNKVVRMTDPAERAAQLAKADAFAKELRERLPEQSPELAYIEGKTLFLTGDLRGAQRKLDPLLRGNFLSGTKAAEAMGMMADIGMRLDPPQPGLTREYLRKVVEAQPYSVELLMNLAKIEIQLGERESAIQVLNRLLQVAPNNEEARTQLSVLMALDRQGEVSDPILSVIVEADQLLTGDKKRLGDEAAAMKLLQDSLPRHNHDPRLVVRLASLKLASGDRAGALAVVQAGRGAHKDNAMLENVEQQLRATENVESAIAFIDQSVAAPLEKAIAKHRTYAGYGQEKGAADALAEAVRLAPEDHRVVELAFVAALKRQDMTEASRLADVGIRTDADRADGNTFRARLFLAQNNPREAATLLQRAAESGNANSAIFRLLGMTHMQLNRGNDAITAFKRAVELNPADPSLLRMLLTALVQLGSTQEALATARASDAMVRRDPDLRNIWLGLEAGAGNTQFAREMREQILAQQPDDAVNAGSLAELYITERAWDKARALIDRQRQAQDGIALVALDARWHAAQGRWPQGRELFIDYVKGIQAKDPTKLTADPLIAMAQFLLQNGQHPLAVEALRNAVPLQDPKTLNVDSMIGELQLMAGDFAGAETTYRKIIQAGIADPQKIIRKRLLECLVQLRKQDELEKEFAILGDGVDSDPELMCLRAETLRVKGDARAAREMLDRAVSRFPQEATPYYKRARLLMLDQQLIGDAMADLASAVRVRPGHASALRTRANLYLATGRSSDAVRDLRTAVEANPGMDDLRFYCISVLLKLGSDSEAMEIADAAAKARTNDARLFQNLGDVFARAGRWDGAASFYRRVWEQTRGENEAVRYISALLKATPAKLAEADGVLATPSLNTVRSPNLLLTRASIRKKQGRLDEARSDARAALMLTQETPHMALGWAQQALTIFPEPGAAAELFGILRPTPEMTPWLDLARKIAAAEGESGRSEGISALMSLATSQEPQELRIVAIRSLSSILDQQKRWEEALEITRLGLTIAPDDLMLLNNAAFFLAEHLGKGAEAIPLAEKAAGVAGANAAVIDTLATAYWVAGDKPKALGTLDRAINSPMGEVDRAKMTLKLAQWRLESGDRAGALRAADQVRELMIDIPDLAEIEGVDKPLQELHRKLAAS